ncbi:MAG: diguanylate cyclase [Gemmatimonadetes bacterium]|nr:diguanylate cyclase [Gemmatimonadota bacterium]
MTEGPRRRARILWLSSTEVPPLLERLCEATEGGVLTRLSSPEDVEQALDRGIVELLVVDADGNFDERLALCRSMKTDPFNSVVPVVFHSRESRMERIEAAFEAGADEFLNGSHSDRERALRLRMVVERAARDVSVHPTTMLPGTRIIQHDIRRRMDSGERFAVCYADIDAFKEFNDKHSYHRGDRVIWLVSMILRDTVRRLSRRGFVGHVGGDDFIFTLPVADMEPVAREIIDAFDTLMPLQYEEEDRARGFFLAEDRQGNIREMPLMTLSIGAVTNVKRHFSHPGRVGELASEMKTYAKTKEGSVFVVDRRADKPRAARAYPGSAAGAE